MAQKLLYSAPYPIVGGVMQILDISEIICI
jgi:hypothetical protein